MLKLKQFFCSLLQDVGFVICLVMRFFRLAVRNLLKAPSCEEHALLSALLPAYLLFCLAKKLVKLVRYKWKNTAEHLVNLKGKYSDVQPAGAEMSS